MAWSLPSGRAHQDWDSSQDLVVGELELGCERIGFGRLPARSRARTLRPTSIARSKTVFLRSASFSIAEVAAGVHLLEDLDQGVGGGHLREERFGTIFSWIIFLQQQITPSRSSCRTGSAPAARQVQEQVGHVLAPPRSVHHVQHRAVLLVRRSRTSRAGGPQAQINVEDVVGVTEQQDLRTLGVFMNRRRERVQRIEDLVARSARSSGLCEKLELGQRLYVELVRFVVLDDHGDRVGVFEQHGTLVGRVGCAR